MSEVRRNTEAHLREVRVAAEHYLAELSLKLMPHWTSLGNYGQTGKGSCQLTFP